MAVIARASLAVPDDADYRSGAYWFRRHGEKQRDKNGWEAALAVVERATKALPDAEAKKILLWRSSLFCRWSSNLLSKKDAEESLKVLARAQALDPKDPAIAAGIAYHTQETLALLARDQGIERAVAHYQDLRRRFPAEKEIEAMAWSFAWRRIGALADQKKFLEATTAVAELEPLVGPKKIPELGGHAYDLWARHFARAKQWQTALEKYQEGIKKYPEEKRLTDYAAGTVDAWARTFMDRREWDQAIQVYQDGLKLFPDARLLQNNLNYCKSRLSKK